MPDGDDLGIESVGNDLTESPDGHRRLLNHPGIAAARLGPQERMDRSRSARHVDEPTAIHNSDPQGHLARIAICGRATVRARRQTSDTPSVSDFTRQGAVA